RSSSPAEASNRRADPRVIRPTDASSPQPGWSSRDRRLSNAVAFVENGEMVLDVAEDDIGQRPRRYDRCSGGTAPRPGFRGHPSDERDGSAAYRDKFFDHVSQRSAIECACRHVNVLIESGKRSLVAPTDPQQAIRKDPLGVGQMSDDLDDAPLA